MSWYLSLPPLRSKQPGLCVERLRLNDGRTLVRLSQEDERAAPEDITGLEDLQPLFGADGESIAILTDEQLRQLTERLL